MLADLRTHALAGEGYGSGRGIGKGLDWFSGARAQESD
jgi:hypothetical protein